MGVLVNGQAGGTLDPLGRAVSSGDGVFGIRHKQVFGRSSAVCLVPVGMWRNQGAGGVGPRDPDAAIGGRVDVLPPFAGG